jgi:hypothetical protein
MNHKISQRCRKRKELCAGRGIELQQRPMQRAGKALKNIHDGTQNK